jgi:predicted ATP-grasp superfamily ATP-dependent carboligase
VNYPCVLKPYFRSVEWIEKWLPKVFKVTGREELISIYHMTEPYNTKSIIQQWVQGGDDNIYFCLIYMPLRAGEPVLFYGKKIRQWPPGTGSTSMAVPTEDPGIGEISLKLFKDLNVSGFGSVEFKRDAESGRLLIMEPTVGRVNLQSAITDAAGVALPYYALCDMLGLSMPELEKHLRHVKWLCEPYEINNVLRHMRAGRFYALWEYVRSIRGRRRYALFAWNDPMPLFCFFYFFAKHRALKLLHR